MVTNQRRSGFGDSLYGSKAWCVSHVKLHRYRLVLSDDRTTSTKTPNGKCCIAAELQSYHYRHDIDPVSQHRISYAFDARQPSPQSFGTDLEMRSPTLSSPDARPRSPSVVPVLLLIFLVHLANALYSLPLNRVIELRLCQEHYGRRDAIPEKLCKIDEVQSRLAWLQGIMETTLIVCGS
jgi:hypothetical protein